MAEISYTDKVAIQENSEVADINKVKADDMNEIKSVVNTNYSEVGDITDLDTTDQSSIVNAINEIVGKSCLNVRLSSNQTISTSNTDTILQLDTITAQKGTGITLDSSYQVVIGSGIDYIVVSGNICIANPGTSGTKRFIVKQNGTDINRTLIYAEQSYVSTSIASVLIPVEEGDLITLYANCSGTTTVINSGYRDTWLNIQQI